MRLRQAPPMLTPWATGQDARSTGFGILPVRKSSALLIGQRRSQTAATMQAQEPRDPTRSEVLTKSQKDLATHPGQMSFHAHCG